MIAAALCLILAVTDPWALNSLRLSLTSPNMVEVMDPSGARYVVEHESGGEALEVIGLGMDPGTFYLMMSFEEPQAASLCSGSIEVAWNLKEWFFIGSWTGLHGPWLVAVSFPGNEPPGTSFALQGLFVPLIPIDSYAEATGAIAVEYVEGE